MTLDDIYASLELLEQTVASLEQDLDTADAQNETLMKNAIASAIVKAKAEAKAEFKAELKSKRNEAPDLFSQNWVQQPVVVSKPSNDKNAAILAQKLDSTIDKVQALLREAGA